MSKLIIEKFIAKEEEDLNQSNFITAGLITVIGLPSVVAGATQGAAIGSAIGAPFAGIGLLPGATLGAILGGSLAFLGIGAGSWWLLPKLGELCIKVWRRISQGSYDYRLNAFILKKEVELKLEKMIEIAKSLKKLQLNGLINESYFSYLKEGLSDAEKNLFDHVFEKTLQHSSDEAAKHAISQTPETVRLKEGLFAETLVLRRSEKKWAKQTLKIDPQDATAKKVENGISAGRSPMAFFHRILRIFAPNKPSLVIARPPVPLYPQIQQRILHYPHLALRHARHLIRGLLGLEQKSINAFASEVINKIQAYDSQSPQDLKNYYGTLTDELARAHAYRSEITYIEEEKTFLDEVILRGKVLFSQDPNSKLPSLFEMDIDTLSAHLRSLALLESHSEHDPAVQSQYRYQRLRGAALLKSLTAESLRIDPAVMNRV